MRIIGLLEVGCWVVFMLVWLVGAVLAKRNLAPTNWWVSIWPRVIVLIIAYVFLRSQITAGVTRYLAAYSPNILLASLGLALTALGIAFAIWARVYIGTNWGMPMTLKADRQLVTSGPYKYVRHPIYTGIFLAALGTAFIVGPVFLIAVAFAFAYFFFAAKSEESTLTKEFPVDYPAYMKRSKMLIPFVI
jgi:protein-S-isoprenylcysteine O-methyltransferase Ste14